MGSSTDLISQKVERVEDMDKRNRLMNLLQSQRMTGKNGKVRILISPFDSLFLDYQYLIYSIIWNTAFSDISIRGD